MLPQWFKRRDFNEDASRGGWAGLRSQTSYAGTSRRSNGRKPLPPQEVRRGELGGTVNPVRAGRVEEGDTKKEL